MRVEYKQLKNNMFADVINTNTYLFLIFRPVYLMMAVSVARLRVEISEPPIAELVPVN